MSFISAYLPYLQISLALLLISAILFQQSDAGLGTAFGGSTSSNPFATKRGAERTLFFITIILAILFIASAVLALF
ncbi:MAG: preprotein translocase subunit SecG [Patescibacteria group bacterium]